MGDSTVADRSRTEHRSRTASHLALPGAAALHVLEPPAISLVLGALVSSASTSSLTVVATVVGVGFSLVVLALSAAGVLAHVRAAKAGGPRGRAWTLAWSALAASLVLGALYALLWYSGIGIELLMTSAASLVVSVAGLLLAAVALVAGLVVTFRGPRRPSAAAVASLATPAALLTPLIGMVLRSPGAYTVATYAGVVLAVVGLVAATVALRRDENGAPGAVGTAGTAGTAGGRGRSFLRHLATPLALTALVLAVPSLTVDDGGALTVLVLLAAFALAVAAIVGAVLDVRTERRAGSVRVAASFAAGTIPLAIALVPAAVALATLFGDEAGWAVLGALFISVPLAAVVALLGLVAAIVAASAGQYPGRMAAASVLCTALVPAALALFVPLQAAGLALGSAVLAGLLLLAALVTGLTAVASAGTSTGTGTPENPETATTPENPYR